MIGALGVLLALGGAPDAPVGPEAILQQEKYHFCHEDTFPLLPEERAFCPLVGEVSDACPALPRACAAPTSPEALARRRSREQDAQSKRGAPGEQAEDAPSARGLPSAALSGGAKVLFFLLLAACLAGVVWALRGTFLRHPGRDGEDEGEPPPAPEDELAAAPERREPIETGVAQLLERARAAAARGDHERALADAYAALLRKLDAEGLIEIHPCRTNGDYLRTLRDKPELRAAVRAVFGDVERVQFGAEPASRAVFQSVYDRVVALSARALGAVALCFSLAAAGLSCDGHDLGGGATWGGTSPLGTRALVELLAARGVEVRHRTRPLSQLGEQRAVLVLLEGAQVEPEAWPGLLAWVNDQGGVLLVAGPEPVAEHVEVQRIDEAQASPQLSISDWHVERLGDEAPAVPGKGALELRGTGPRSLLWRLARDGAGAERPALYATYQELGRGAVVVFPDGELFTNIALAIPHNGAFLASLLGSFELPVELCDRFTGFGAASPVASLREAELTPLVLQLLGLAALFLLWKGRAFGALRDPPARSRRAFADHARALGLCYARARAARHVSGLYAGFALDRLRERLPGGARGGLAPLAESLAARTGRPEAEVVALLVEAHGARDGAGPSSSRASNRPPGGEGGELHHLALMRQLHDLLSATSSPTAGAEPGAPAKTPGGEPARHGAGKQE